MEIPTGVIADKVSRKLSVGIGYILTSLPFVFLPFVNSFVAIFLIFATKAVGKACISGADTAILYDSLVDLGRQKEYKTILNRAKTGTMIVSAICIALGGVLSKYNIDLTLILPFPLMLIGAVCAFMMREPESTKKSKIHQHKNYFKHTFFTIKGLLTQKIILLGTIIFLLQDAMGINMKRFYTPIFEKLGFSLALIGGVTSVFYVMKAFASGIGSKIMSESQLKNVIGYGVTSFVLLFISGFVFETYIIIPALIVVLVSIEIIDSSIDEFLHERIESHHRSTAMSSISMIGSISSTVILYAFGFTQGFWGINVGVIFLSAVFLFIFLIGWYTKRKFEV